jgi:hypothetical protein
VINKTYSYEDRAILFTGEAEESSEIDYFMGLVCEFYQTIPREILISPIVMKFEKKNQENKLIDMLVHASEPYTIKVVPENILAKVRQFDEKMRRLVLVTAFVHEYVHLLHEQVSGALSKAEQRHKNVFHALDSVGADNNIDRMLLVNRQNLDTLKSLLLLEGVASHCQFLLSQDFMNELIGKHMNLHTIKDFDDGYREAAKATYKLKTSWELLLSVHHTHNEKSSFIHAASLLLHQNQRFAAHVSGGDPYTIGQHMVQTLLMYAKDLPLVKLLELEPAAFIRLYEECIAHSGKAPLISHTSGKGLFDFKRAQEELLTVYNERKAA